MEASISEFPHHKLMMAIFLSLEKTFFVAKSMNRVRGYLS